MSDDYLLDDLLSAVSEVTGVVQTSVKPSLPQLTETNFLSKESNVSDNTPPPALVTKGTATNKSLSLVHTGDTDSSDDEENRYFDNRKYNESGTAIKHLLGDDDNNIPSTSNNNNSQSITTRNSNNNSSVIRELGLGTIESTKTKVDVYTDPVFGLRIINPLVSSSLLLDRMRGREAVQFNKLASFLKTKTKDINWVLGGVLTSKSLLKTAQSGNQFIVWTLSDLKDDIKTVSVLIFKPACKDLWKTAAGTVLGILNPLVLNKKEGSKDIACLSVGNTQQIMILGQSKDFGMCRSTKKNGDKCQAIVNINRCEFCVYHIKQEYQKCSSKRSELQSSFAGKGLTALRNKVLGKNEVFYAGKSFMAIPAKKSRKLEKKDAGRLRALSNDSYQQGDVTLSSNLPQTNKRKKKAAAHLEVSQSQRLKDMELLKKLGGGINNNNNNFDVVASHSSDVSIEASKNLAVGVIAKLKAAKTNDLAGKPTITHNNSPSTLKSDVPVLLGGSKGNKMIDLNTPISKKLVDRVKLKAIKLIEKSGPIAKIDPNCVKTNRTKKRPIEIGLDDDENNLTMKKKLKTTETNGNENSNEFMSDRFKKMMAATSKHMDLLEQHDNAERDKYFSKLEAKERMEEKMCQTYKVACKAVRCLKCKYTSFSASDLCKEERHPFKVFDAVKRFFQCGGCGNRTVTLDVVPTGACKNCGGGKWERTGMMKERSVVVAHNLSIRGGEQKFINSVASDSNINLLMPSED